MLPLCLIPGLDDARAPLAHQPGQPECLLKMYSEEEAGIEAFVLV